MSDLLWAKYHDLQARLAAIEAFFGRTTPDWNKIPDNEMPPPNAELQPWEKPVVQADGSVTPPPPIGTHSDDRRLLPEHEYPNPGAPEQPKTFVYPGGKDALPEGMVPMTVREGEPADLSGDLSPTPMEQLPTEPVDA